MPADDFRRRLGCVNRIHHDLERLYCMAPRLFCERQEFLQIRIILNSVFLLQLFDDFTKGRWVSRALALRRDPADLGARSSMAVRAFDG
jgi:hypothetical protein